MNYLTVITNNVIKIEYNTEYTEYNTYKITNFIMLHEKA